jgi:Nucleotidyl transferase AbiEii toxin, Type IV TA system
VQRHSKASSPGSPDPRTPTDWLKGGVLLAAYDARRPTRDVDIQARAIAGDRDDVLQDDVLQLVRDIAAGAMDDGLVFDTDAATADIIRDDDDYGGVRITLTATLASAKLGLHIDVNIGDPIWPPAPCTCPNCSAGRYPGRLSAARGVRGEDHYRTATRHR